MKNLTHSLLFVALLTSPSVFAQRKMEKLDRGVVAVRTSPTQVYIGWRLLGNDADNTTFNIYRGTTKLNSTPLSISTNFTDNTDKNETYTIKAVVNGVEQTNMEQAKPVLLKNYIEIPLKIPQDGMTPDGVAYTYNANDCSVGDLDGDGEYEIVLKWEPSNAKDNSQAGYTGNVYLDAYKMNGKHLWRIDLGKNIRAGAHYTQFMVYDFDSDGKAEVTCRTSDGTIDGKGKVIGNASADYRNTSGYVLTGPEFQTVFNGETGAAMASVDYIPARGTVASWGDNYGNRVDRFVDAVAYIDGVRPTLITGRGYYTRLVRVAWHWRNGQLTKAWEFDSKNGNLNFEGQGNHNMTVGDVDGDGKDEIVNGASAIDHDGKALYVNGLGHGDALHMGDFDPDRAGLEVYQCHETPSLYGDCGMDFRDAKTGKPIFCIDGQDTDVGRCMAADIDPRYKGVEVWGAKGGLYSAKGVLISASRPSSMNFGIWWDADLTRELLDGNRIMKWNPANNTLPTIFTADSCTSNNGTKATPSLSADLLGDWREEVILRKVDNSALRIFTTTIPSDKRFYTLMHDPQYRVAIAWQNSAYNQPPHPSFYLGDSMLIQPRPNIDVTPDVRTSIHPVDGRSGSVKVYPNPSDSTFFVDTEGGYAYRIFDLSGKVLESGKRFGKSEIGSNIRAGFYFVNIEQRDFSSIFKVLKSK